MALGLTVRRGGWGAPVRTADRRQVPSSLGEKPRGIAQRPKSERGPRRTGSGLGYSSLGGRNLRAQYESALAGRIAPMIHNGWKKSPRKKTPHLPFRAVTTAVNQMNTTAAMNSATAM